MFLGGHFEFLYVFNITRAPFINMVQYQTRQGGAIMVRGSCVTEAPLSECVQRYRQHLRYNESYVQVQI